VVALRYFDFESTQERGIVHPTFRFFHLDRSFYSQDNYDSEIRAQEEATKQDAENAANRDATAVPPDEVTVSRKNRQDEARMGQYVKKALEDLYANNFGPEEKTCVFDVHSVRPGGTFENVDLLAVHWQPRDICDNASEQQEFLERYR
jgi:hypothetical protein